RLEILAELAGMVQHWKEQGRPPGSRGHRCGAWARTVGGILAANGLDRFLTNLSEVQAAMDEGLQTLGTLAEHVINKGKSAFFAPAGEAGKDTGRRSRDWVPLFLDAELCQNELAHRTRKGCETWVGQFLSSKVDRPVEVFTDRGNGTAVLKSLPGRG